MKKSMRKVLCALALLALPFAMQAQTKYHDVELNDATGPVKSIKTEVMGESVTNTFSKEGKLESGSMTDIVYDADGFAQSANMDIRGQKIALRLKWENGKLVGQSMNMMGQDVNVKFTFGAKGERTSQTLNMGGQNMEMPYEDYQFDARGNWISRKSNMMGRDMVEKRTIEYYE